VRRVRSRRLDDRHTSVVELKQTTRDMEHRA